ncbi:MAG: aminotransferase class I/II-fold pyridoxal phosphate-dependent enzyme [Clostridiales bacterium]|nr:aminotransferase class I/II-fold pyridoxal phosphate-dependent enzyme [Clostridiales bacterium]
MIPLNQNLSALKRSAIRVYTNMAKEVPGCVMLTIGEPDFDTPQAIKAAACAALAAGQTHYAPNQGTAALRKAVADYETRRGRAVTPEQVLITVGATHALFTALLGILNPGEEVIVPTPGFGLYETIATVAGAKTVRLDVTKNNFQITKEALEAAITPKTKAIILNSPCNPTGVVLSAESMANVKAAVLGKPIFVISDNVYSQLSDGNCPDLSLDAELNDQLILCQSFSKPYAMTGWRIGYLTCPDYVMDRLLLLSAGEIAAVPTFLQDAAVEALKTDPGPMRDTYAKRRAYITARLRDMGLSFPEPEGAFYVFVDVRQFGMDSAQFCTRMIREAAVAAVPGSCFGSEGYIRLSYCCSDSDLEIGMDRMEAFIQALRACCGNAFGG